MANFANFGKGVKKVTRDLRSKLRLEIENICTCSKDVKRAIALAKATSDRKEEEFQEQERKFAAKHRKELSIFAYRSQKELESAREWQIQRDLAILSRFLGFIVEIILTRIGENKMKLLDSLSTYAYEANFHQARKKRHLNTATWLLSTQEFTKWKDGEASSVFILTGKRELSPLLSRSY